MISTEEYKIYLNDQITDGFGDITKNQIKGYVDLLNDLIHFDKDVKVLDVGCREFHTRHFFDNIIGIDICNMAIRHLEGSDNPVINMDAHNMPYDGIVNIVLAIHSLEHMYDLNIVLRNIKKALVKNGYFFLAVPFPCKRTKRGHWQEIAYVEDFLDRLEDAGFLIVWNELRNKESSIRNESELIVLCK